MPFLIINVVLLFLFICAPLHSLQYELKPLDPMGNVDTYDYLGFTIDNHPTMIAHVDKIIKKISYKLSSLSIMRQFISERTGLLIYKVMIMPHFHYVDFVIDSVTSVKTCRLERLHRRAIRIIEYTTYPESRKSFNELYEKDNLSSLYQLCVEHLILFMNKISKISTKNIEVHRQKIN